MAGLVHFSNFLIPSEKYYKLQSCWITLYIIEILSVEKIFSACGKIMIDGQPVYCIGLIAAGANDISDTGWVHCIPGTVTMKVRSTLLSKAGKLSGFVRIWG